MSANPFVMALERCEREMEQQERRLAAANELLREARLQLVNACNVADLMTDDMANAPNRIDAHLKEAT